MPTFGAWEDTVLDRAWDVADYISLHSYYDPDRYPTLDGYLACSEDLGAMIDGVAAIADGVAARRRSRRRIGLSVDEWNVWYQTGNPDYERNQGPFERAPGIAQDVHNVADALVVGCLLITLLQRADRVRIACLAQLLNTIAPIQTRDGGPAWRQTTYYPFLHASRFGRGTVLRVEPDAGTYETEDGRASILEAAAVQEPTTGGLTVFAVNRGASPLELELVVRDLPGLRLSEHIVLADEDLRAANTELYPERVLPRTLACRRADRAVLPPRSWNVLRITPAEGSRPPEAHR